MKVVEDALVSQIQALNDDSIFNDKESAKMLVERSKAISDLACRFVEMDRMKLEAIRVYTAAGYKPPENAVGQKLEPVRPLSIKDI